MKSRSALVVLCALIASTVYATYTTTDVRVVPATGTFYTDNLTPQQNYFNLDGTKYLVGGFKGTFTLAGTTYGTAGQTYFDIYIIKYKSNGALDFVKVIPVHTTQTTTPYFKGAVTPDGSFYIACTGLTSQFTLDGTVIPALTTSTSGVLIKLTPTGTLSWYRTLSGVSLVGVRQMSDNGAAVFAMGSADATWSNGLGTLAASSATLQNDLIYYRFTSTGSIQWSLRRPETVISTQSTYLPNHQFVGNNDNIYTSSIKTEKTNQGSSAFYGPVNNQNAIIEKVNSAGVYQWTVRVTSGTTTGNPVEVTGVTTDSSDNVYITGYYKATSLAATSLRFWLSTGSNAAVYTQQSTNLAGVTSTFFSFVAKLNSAGTLQWAKRFGGTGTSENEGLKIAYSPDDDGVGVLAVVGYYSSNLPYDNSNTNILSKQSGSGNDAYVFLIDANTGAYKQSEGFVSQSADSAFSVTQSLAGFDIYAFFTGAATIGGTAVATNSAVLFHYENMVCGDNFDPPTFKSRKPVITATSNSNTITIQIVMYRQTKGNISPTVWHNLDTKPDGSNVCRQASTSTASDSIQPSAGVSWNVASSASGCSVTYTLTQTLAQIVSGAANNNWVPKLGSDGLSITYSLPLYSTYSVNSDFCYFAGYRFVVSFRTVLSINSASTSFVTFDGAAKFAFSGLRITDTTPANVEIKGTIIPLIPNSEIRAITLAKTSGTTNNPSFTVSQTTCTAYNTGCPQTYSALVSAFGGAGTDISGVYTTTMDVYEGIQTKVLTRPGTTLTYSLNYMIPGSPTVVDGENIQTESKLYTTDDYTVIRTASYQTATNSLYIENSIVAGGPAIPSNYRLVMTNGYLCCVNYLTTLTEYNPTTQTGGCIPAEKDTKEEWVDLGTEGSHATGIVETPSDAANANRYRLAVTLANVFQNQHDTPLTCNVLLLSKFIDTSTGRRVEAADFTATYTSSTNLLVEANGNLFSSASKATFASVITLVFVGVAFLL